MKSTDHTEKKAEKPEIGKTDFNVTFPSLEADTICQDREYCMVEFENEKKRIRFHDYQEIYSIPGLYEHIFYEVLKCRSPQLIGKLLENELERADRDASELTVLDVGAGNGIMGEVLRDMGVRRIVGVDILEEARMGALRDRPGVYSEYHAGDLTALSPEMEEALCNRNFNCMTLVAALGFGDIPPEVFSAAFNYIRDGGWIAFNIKDEFLKTGHESGFSRLIRRMEQQGTMKLLVQARYVHRLSISGEELMYTVMLGRKLCDVSPSLNGS
ncbi:MAG: methyltransferase domain-containing protein [Deltaproteobacteria bacterium]|nr:methyltransferase domain-containing protein [Deltaproteobacteria bacterium]